MAPENDQKIKIEYGEIIRISPYSVRMREDTDQNNSEYGHFSQVLVLTLDKLICSQVIKIFCDGLFIFK